MMIQKPVNRHLHKLGLANRRWNAWNTKTPFVSTWYTYVFTNSIATNWMWLKVSFQRSFTSLNSEYSFSEIGSHTKSKELSLSYYLPIAGGRIVGFIPFPSVLSLYEMLTAWSRIRTRVAESVSYNDNHYTTSASGNLIIWYLPSKNNLQFLGSSLQV